MNEEFELPLDTPETRKLKKDAGIPHLPTKLTYECRLAMSGEGPLAHTWEDKPHRLIFYLCSALEYLANEKRKKGDKTFLALEKSIKKWTMLTKVKKPSQVYIGYEHCPLCDLFYNDPTDPHNCTGCPISNATGKPNCRGTPYLSCYDSVEEWDDEPENPKLKETFHQNAKKMVEFLESLLKKENENV